MLLKFIHKNHNYLLNRVVLSSLSNRKKTSLALLPLERSKENLVPQFSPRKEIDKKIEVNASCRKRRPQQVATVDTGTRDLGLRKPKLLESNVLRPRPPKSFTDYEKEDLFNEIRLKLNEPFDQNVWDAIAQRIQKLRPYFLPPELGQILQAFSDMHYDHKYIIEDISKSLLHFCDLQTLLKSMIALENLKYPTDELSTFLMERLNQQGLHSFTFLDLRLLLITFSIILPKLSHSRISAGSSEHQSILIQIIQKLFEKLLETERPVIETKVPRTSEFPRNTKRNKHRVHQKNVIQGLIGIDSRDLFFISFGLFKVNIFDQLLLQKCIERLTPYISGRLRAKPIDVMLCLEGYSYWYAQCREGGHLCTPDITQIKGPIALSTLPFNIKKEKNYDESNKKNMLVGGDHHALMMPSEMEEAIVLSTQFHLMIQRCEKYIRFLLECSSVMEIVNLGQQMQSRGIQGYKTWNVWSDVLENSKRGAYLSELNTDQIMSLIPLWRWLGKSTRQLQYQLAQKSH